MFESLRILHYPDPVLRKKCAPILPEDFAAPDKRTEMAALVRRMGELVIEHNGVGLAAPQVGLGIRLFVVNTSGEPGQEKAYLNSELGDLIGQFEAEEGCLSIPGVNVTIRRAEEAVIRAWDLAGRPFEETGRELIVRVWQHETDHINGRLILDYMNEETKLVNRRAIQELEREYKQRTKGGRSKSKPRARKPVRE